MWQCITTPEMRQEYWSTIDEIAECLAATVAHSEADPGMGNGTPGIALFFAYLDAAGRGADAAERAMDALARSTDALAQRQTFPALYSGFCGLGWVVEHLTRELFEGDGDLSEGIDEALERILADVRETPPFELVGGLAGYGIYLLERLPNPRAAKLLTRVIELLDQSAEESDEGIAWFTPPEWLPDWQRAAMPQGYYNVGVAHGIPGIIGFLAAARREGVDDPRLDRLAAGAIRWVMHRRISHNGSSVFPAWILRDSEPVPTRTAWCYGDIGVAAALLFAARSFGRADWEHDALAIARGAAARSVEDTQTIDASLCHGSTGLAHLFNRFHQATGDAELRDAALAWYRRALDMRRPGEEFAGLLSWIADMRGNGSWQAQPGFLIGIAGIGLGLLAAVTEIEPKWDRVLLASIPPRNGDRS